MKKLIIFFSFLLTFLAFSNTIWAQDGSTASGPNATPTEAPTLEEVQKAESIPQSSRPDSVEKVQGATTINVHKAEELFQNHLIFIDVRRDNDWTAGHIPLAHHLFLDTDFTLDQLQKIVPDKSTPIVIYCNGKKCWRSSAAARLAVEWGYKNVYYFRDGFPAWKLDGNPVE